MAKRYDSPIGLDLVKGAVAGAVATFVMDRLTQVLHDHEDPAARRQEKRARGRRTVPQEAAHRAARASGRRLTRSETRVAGTVLHWVTGVGAGAAYGALRHRFPQITRAGGTAFGAGFFVLVDETVPPLLGLSAPPQDFPWQAHVRGLSGHVVFGAVTEGVLELLDRVR